MPESQKSRAIRDVSRQWLGKHADAALNMHATAKINFGCTFFFVIHIEAM
jgi:hypothetical protein